ncbi:MAG TPA: ATP-binding protein [Acetobacteraceae bacterium]|nr:ATP-binding protein [Acetobacteraceae bacterium]
MNTETGPLKERRRIFPDAATTIAADNRLVHHATIFEFNVESFRRRTATAAAEIAA